MLCCLRTGNDGMQSGVGRYLLGRDVATSRHQLLTLLCMKVANDYLSVERHEISRGAGEKRERKSNRTCESGLVLRQRHFTTLYVIARVSDALKLHVYVRTYNTNALPVALS